MISLARRWRAWHSRSFSPSKRDQETVTPVLESYTSVKPSLIHLNVQWSIHAREVRLKLKPSPASIRCGLMSKNDRFRRIKFELLLRSNHIPRRCAPRPKPINVLFAATLILSSYRFIVTCSTLQFVAGGSTTY